MPPCGSIRGLGHFRTLEVLACRSRKGIVRARANLAYRKRSYFERVGFGSWLGYRPSLKKDGTWSARKGEEGGKGWERRIAYATISSRHVRRRFSRRYRSSAASIPAGPRIRPSRLPSTRRARSETRVKVGGRLTLCGVLQNFDSRVLIHLDHAGKIRLTSAEGLPAARP
jgi:hypothetical protein